MKLFKELFLVIFVGLLSVWTLLPLFHAGFFPMHDNTQVQRVYEMGKSLREGMLPVRWVSELGYGYGYPIFTFYAPLAYYIGGLSTFVTLSLPATKIMIGLGILLSGIFMYFFAQKIFGKLGGVVASVFYMYAPYHAVDIYVRGDIAELWAYAFIPLAFYGFWKIEEDASWKHVVIAALGFAGIILSHNLTALMVTPFLLVFAIFFTFLSKRKLYTLRYSLYAFLLGIGLSAFYFLPVFGEMKYTNVLSQIGGGADFHDHFVCLSQLWQSPWGYGGSVKGCVDGLSFMIGKLHILLSVLSLFLLPFSWKNNKKTGGIVIFSLVSFLIVCFLMLSQSVFIWNILKPMTFLQYPWRFLLLASFFTSILVGSIVAIISNFIPKPLHLIVVAGIVIGVVILYAKFFVPQTYVVLPNSWYISKQTFFDVSKISNEYMPKDFKKPLSFNQVPKTILQVGKGSASLLVNRVQEKKIFVTLPKAQKVLIHMAYFPAWKATVDGKGVSLFPTPEGMLLAVPQGNHILNISYTETPLELLGDILSLTSAFILILVIIKGQASKFYGSKSS